MNPGEENLLFDKYPNISSLAQALCHEPQSRHEIRLIHHIESTLEDWIGNNNSKATIFPVILER